MEAQLSGLLPSEGYSSYGRNLKYGGLTAAYASGKEPESTESLLAAPHQPMPTMTTEDTEQQSETTPKMRQDSSQRRFESSTRPDLTKEAFLMLPMVKRLDSDFSSRSHSQ